MTMQTIAMHYYYVAHIYLEDQQQQHLEDQEDGEHHLKTDIFSQSVSNESSNLAS